MKFFCLLFVLIFLSFANGCTQSDNSSYLFVRSVLKKKSIELPNWSRKKLMFECQFETDRQSLEINWKTKDTIEFRLVADWLPCIFTQVGTAVLNQSKSSKVSRHHSDCREYVVLENGQLKSILIQFPRKAWIVYDNEEEMDECDPDSECTMLLLK